jgi:hypothetical protein
MTTKRAVSWALVALLVTAASAFAQSRAVYNKFKGQLVVADQPLNVTDDDGETIKALKAAKGNLAKTDNKWPFYFVAFLSKKAGHADLSLLFFEKGKKDMKFYKDISGVDPNGNIIAFDLEFTEDDDGVKPGTTYDVQVAHVSGSKTTVLAKGRVTFNK